MSILFNAKKYQKYRKYYAAIIAIIVFFRVNQKSSSQLLKDSFFSRINRLPYKKTLSSITHKKNVTLHSTSKKENKEKSLIEMAFLLVKGKQRIDGYFMR